MSDGCNQLYTQVFAFFFSRSSDFPIRYEGPHVISGKQVWVGVVSKGSDGTALNSSYANR